MAETGRKVEVRLGAFACRIEGYDDPVGRMREIVGLLQRAVAETPALADHFDEAQIERIEHVLGTSAGHDGGTPSSVVVIRAPEDAEAASEAGPGAGAAGAGRAGDATAGPAAQEEMHFISGEKLQPESGSGAIFAAPAAAVAEAAFSADIAELGEFREEPATAQRQLGAGAGAQATPAPEGADAIPEPEETAGAAAAAARADATAEPEPDTARVTEGGSAPTEPMPRTGIAIDPTTWPTGAEAPAPAFNIFATPEGRATSIDIPASGSEPAAPAINIFAPPSTAPGAIATIEAGPESAPTVGEIAADFTADRTNGETDAPDGPDGARGASATTEAAGGTAQPAEPGIRDKGALARGIAAAGISALAAGSDEDHCAAAGRPSEPDGAVGATDDDASPGDDAPSPAKRPAEADQARPAPGASPALAATGGAPAEPVPAPESEWAAVTAAPEETDASPAGEPPRADAGAPDRAGPGTAEPVTTAPTYGRAAATAEVAPASRTAHPSELGAAEPAGTRGDAKTAGGGQAAVPAAEESADVPEAEPENAGRAAAAPGPNRFATMIARLQGKSPAPGPEIVTQSRPASVAAVDSTSAQTAAGAAGGGASAPTAAELAAKAGAREVPDLLAASAAWLTLVERRPRFTRRDVMEVFEELPGDHPQTLEARIKGFGQLVGANTLVLVDDGVFAMNQSERDRFRALMDQR